MKPADKPADASLGVDTVVAVTLEPIVKPGEPHSWKSRLAGGSLAVLVIAGVIVVWLAVWHEWTSGAKAQAPAPVATDSTTDGVELVADRPHTIAVPEEVRRNLGIVKDGVTRIVSAKEPTQTRSMVLPGSTALDPTRLYRIRARFAPARVTEIAQVRDEAASQAAGKSVFRELRPGDRVQKGDVLAVFYSVDVGNKKNDLIDAISQRYLDEEILEKAEKAFRTGALPEIYMLNAQRNVEADRNAERRAVNNLRTWDIPEPEIKACYDEAERLKKLKGKERDLAKVEKNDMWPVVKLVAPDDGVILERNVTRAEMIVDPTVNLFQIGNVDRLWILANCPEDDLPVLHDLKPDQLKWTIRTVGANAVEGLKGRIDEIGFLIDPNQHTAIIKGHIDNPRELIRGGQFISATIKLPPPPGVVEIPIDALVDDGQQAVVFVQPDPAKHEYTLRRVQVTHRFEKTAFVRCTAIPKEQQRSKEEEEMGLLPKEPLHAGERILVTAVGELKAALLDLESKKTESKPGKDK
jgi:cobalt-zinc-cadmium efflux system membrane fusion protein